jgi:membrane protease YdiL (CAAX protease family)
MSGRVLTAVGVQAAFVAVAVVWRSLHGASALHDGAPLGGTHTIAVPLGLSVGALVGVVAVVVSRALVRNTRWGREMHLTLRDGLLDLSRDRAPIAPMALSAAIGEEILFRGAVLPTLLPQVGTFAAVILSSLAFGLLHVPRTRSLVPWTATACVMGVVFAALYVATGEVLAPIAAHAVVNYENLHFILANDLRDHPATAG